MLRNRKIILASRPKDDDDSMDGNIKRASHESAVCANLELERLITQHVVGLHADSHRFCHYTELSWNCSLNFPCSQSAMPCVWILKARKCLKVNIFCGNVLVHVNPEKNVKDL